MWLTFINKSRNCTAKRSNTKTKIQIINQISKHSNIEGVGAREKSGNTCRKGAERSLELETRRSE